MTGISAHFIIRSNMKKLIILLACGTHLLAQQPAIPAPPPITKPTLYIIGDSTVRNNTPGQQGWGDPLKTLFDPTKIQVENHAIGGRSSRTFLTEGRWQTILDRLKPGDFVLMQFGHNDGGALDSEKNRATIRGIGEESQEVTPKGSTQPITIHSFGWYMRHYVTTAKAKGATPIVLSLIPRNIWKNGRVERSTDDYALWAKQVATEEQVPFIPFNDLLADAYDAMGEEKLTAVFAPGDHTHPAPAGAAINAHVLADALRQLNGTPLGNLLLPRHDALRLPSVIADHMVLQRDQPIRLWGWGKPATQVQIHCGPHSAQGKVAADGTWQVQLPGLPAGGPHEIEILDDKTQLHVRDVLVGEVWVCSGQSNMDFTVATTEKRYFAGTAQAAQEIAAAQFPQIRHYSADWSMSHSVCSDNTGNWQICSPTSVGDFSAVAYFFGRRLHQELKVPIGLITCAYGASTAEAWIQRDDLNRSRPLRPLLEAFDQKYASYQADTEAPRRFSDALAKWEKDQQARRAAGQKPSRRPANPDPSQDQHNPTVLYNGMIAPVQRYAVRGAIWYQGESNSGSRQLYPELQRTLIESWRRDWNCGKFPFYFVQLAAHGKPQADPSTSSRLAEMREAQATSLSLPDTGMAVTIDVGEEKDVHPRDKQSVGYRLAQLALTGCYDRPGVAHGPVFVKAEPEGSQLRVRFQSCGSGLIAKNDKLEGFAIAAADGKFVPASATIDGDTVRLHADAITSPIHVRYAWADFPTAATLYNREGLPAVPFRSGP